GEFDRLEIAVERHPLAEFLQSRRVDRLEPKKHRAQPEARPEAKRLLVAQEDVATGLEIIGLLDAGAGDCLADLDPAAFVDKGHVVDDEDSRLADRAQVFDDAFGADEAITAPVEGPGAAKRTVPWATARHLDRGARVERADEVFAAMAQEIAGRDQIVERFDKPGRRPLARRGDGARNPGRICARLDRREEQRHARLALAFQDAVDGAFGMG